MNQKSGQPDAVGLGPSDGSKAASGNPARPRVAAARRVVVKVGSSSLTTPSHRIDPGRVEALVDALAAAQLSGRQIVLVSSGAIAAGLGPLGLTSRPRDLASQQAAASVGQGLLMERYAGHFAAHGLIAGQVLLTVDDTTQHSTYGNVWRTFDRLLEFGAIPVVNENDTVATHEIRFGDNDRLAALVAELVRADALVLLSDVDGLYTAPPGAPDARLVPEVSSFDDLDDLAARSAGRSQSDVGTGGMATKLASARIALGGGIPVVLARGDQVGPALAGEAVGTYFLASADRRPARLAWLAGASRVAGELVLDVGAIRAVTTTAASVLPAGVLAVRGRFEAGDVVRLVDEAGQSYGRGIVNYDADVLPTLLGQGTQELARRLGPRFSRVVVHRDQMVIRSGRPRPPRA
ncbi:MAG: glutamate 5-kinase [Propionibacteriaceae bacterium]|jgi:glutamate 5-kinase|nr:glutamate 5-kinase [Propionibacteriaceae bacterium]